MSTREQKFQKNPHTFEKRIELMTSLRYISGFLLVIFFGIAISVIPNQTLQADDINSFSEILAKSAKTTPQEVHFALAVAKRLSLKREDFGLTDEKLCPIISQTKATDSKTIFHITSASSVLVCPKLDVKYLEQKLTQNLAKTSTLDMFHTVKSISVLSKTIKSLTDKDTLKKLYDALIRRFDSNTGLFCRKKTSYCVDETGLALNTLSSLQTLLLRTDLSTVELINQLTKVAGKVNSTVSIFKGLNKISLGVASNFMVGLNRFGSVSALDTKVSLEDIEAFLQILLKLKDKVATLADAYDFLEAFSSLTSSNIHVPIYISKPTIDYGKKTISFVVSDYWGKPIDGKVAIERVYNAADEDEVFFDSIDLNPSSSDGGNTPGALSYSWSFANKLDSGIVNVEILVSPSKITETQQPVKKTVTLKFETTIDIKDFHVTLAEVLPNGIHADQTTFHVKYPQGTLTQKLPIRQNTHIAFDFSIVTAANGKEFPPHQVFIRFVHQKSQQESVFVVRRMSQGYKIEFDLQKTAGTVFNNRPGDYNVELIVGDEVLKHQVLWQVGVFNLDIEFIQNPRDLALGMKPDIHHMFRQPAKRPSKLLSMTFTGLLLGTFFIFLLALLRLGFNLSGFPGLGLGFLLNIVFQLIILGMLMVVVLYWLTISIFDAFTYLGALGLAASVIGSLALRSVHNKA